MNQNAIRQAILELRKGNVGEAQNQLIPLIKADPNNEQAWLIFVTTFESDQEKIDVLQRFLKLNPGSINGANLLISLKERIESSEVADPQATKIDITKSNLLTPEKNHHLNFNLNDDSDFSYESGDDTGSLMDLVSENEVSESESFDLFDEKVGETSEFPSFFTGAGTDLLNELSDSGSINNLPKIEDEAEKENDVFEALEALETEDDFEMPSFNFDDLVKGGTGDLDLDHLDDELKEEPFDLNLASLSDISADATGELKSIFLEDGDETQMEEDLFEDINLEDSLTGYSLDTDDLFEQVEVPDEISSIVSEKESPPESVEQLRENVFLEYDEIEETIQEENAADELDIREELAQDEKKRKHRKKREKNNKVQNRKLRRRVFSLIWIVGIIGIYQFLYVPGMLDPYIENYITPVYESSVKPFYESSIKPVYDEYIRPFLPIDDVAVEETNVDLPAIPTEVVEQEKPVFVESMNGQVFVREEEGQDWRSLLGNETVITDPFIETSLGSQIEIKFLDKLIVLLEEESSLEIMIHEDNEVVLTLLSGELFIQNEGVPVSIESSVVNLNLNNGTALFYIDDLLKNGEVNCLDGNCSVVHDSGEVNIGSGMAYVVEANQDSGNVQSVSDEAVRAWITLDEDVFDNLVNSSIPVIGGVVWNDLSMDGVFDENEPVFSGLVVQLIDSQGTVLMETKSDENGHYIFTQPKEGDYYLQANVPTAIYVSSISADNVIDPMTNESELFFLKEDGDSNLSLSIGLMNSKSTSAQRQEKPNLPSLRFAFESKSQGLIDDSITSLYADEQGRLWAATPRGLSVFDNHEWENYRISNGLVNETIFDVIDNGRGLIYVIGLGNELSVFDGKEWSSLMLPDSMQFDPTSSTAALPKLAKGLYGSIWMTFYDQLYYYDGVEWTSFEDVENVLIKDITDIVIDSQNVVWLSHWGGGVSRFDKTEWVYFTEQDGLLSNNVFTLTFDSKQNLIVATDEGLMRFENNVWVPMFVDVAERFDSVHAIYSEAVTEGYKTYETFWIATDHDIYLLQEGSEEQSSVILEHFADIEVTDLVKDANGILWMGTEFGAIREFGGEFINYPNASSPNIYAFVDIAKKNQNDLLVLTSNTLYEIKDGMWIENNLAEINSPIKQVTIDSLDRTWLMTDDQLLTVASGLTNTLDYPSEWFEQSSNYYGFEITERNTTWIATDNFVASQSGFGWAIYDRNNGVPSAPITDFYADDDITVVVTDGGGASILENGIWRFVHQGNGLITNHLSSVIVDQDGVIWFGTYQAGLIRYDGETFESYTTEEGLLNYQITDLAVSEDGILWIGTILGLNAIADGEVFAYTTQDGLPANSINGIVPMDDGSVWVTTTSKSLSQFKP